jgi:hypothetical protein
MWTLILTVTLGTPAIWSVPSVTSERACSDAGVAWESAARKSLDRSVRTAWTCAKL